MVQGKLISFCSSKFPAPKIFLHRLRTCSKSTCDQECVQELASLEDAAAGNGCTGVVGSSGNAANLSAELLETDLPLVKDKAVAAARAIQVCRVGLSGSQRQNKRSHWSQVWFIQVLEREHAFAE